MSHLTIRQKAIIIKSRLEGKTIVQIARHLKKNSDTIGKFVAKLTKTGEFWRKEGSGAKPKITEFLAKKLKKQVLKEPFQPLKINYNAVKGAKQPVVCENTLSRALKKYEYKGSKTSKKTTFNRSPQSE